MVADEKHITIPFSRKKLRERNRSLCIVKDVARKHGGSAWVRSSAANGATFYISIAKDLEVADQKTTL